MESELTQPLELFYCYAREDRALRDKLDAHLAPLRRTDLITAWFDGEIIPGASWEEEIKTHLNTADIILLLISPEFIQSDYCYSKEMNRALERHYAKEARVVPILLRPVYWIGTPFSTLQMLPSDARPVTSWPDRDEAFEDVAKGIRKVVNNLLSQRIIAPAASPQRPQAPLPRLPIESQPRNQGISRRTVVLLGLAALGTGTAGVVWLALTSKSHLQQVTPMPTTLPGTTLLTYRDHRYYIWSVAWSPDGQYIASGSWDQTVQVWDASSGKNIFIYHGHAGGQAGVYTVAWSPDGKRIASGSSDRTVQVWDAFTGDHVFTYRGHSDTIHKLVWSPNGKRIVSGSLDHTAQVWDASTGDHVLTYRGHSDTVGGVAWSPDGSSIASASTDVQVWDASTGRKFRTYSNGRGEVAWSPDGKRIAASFNNTVQVWDAFTGSHVLIYKGHSNTVHSVAWSPDSRRIASASFDSTVQVWDASTGDKVFTYRGHSQPVFQAAWSPDGRRIASGCLDNTVQVWSAG